MRENQRGAAMIGRQAGSGESLHCRADSNIRLKEDNGQHSRG